MAEKTKVDGVAVTLDGVEYTLPPLPLAKMPKIKTLMEGGDMTDEFVGTLINAIHWSLQRNYPAIKHEDVESAVDMLNWKDVLNAFMRVNGFASAGEAPAGEAQGAAAIPSAT
jgi:hypothetical protein